MQPNWLAQRSYLTPNRIGLRFGEQQWTFQQLFEQAQVIAGQLATLQVIKGNRVAILSPSTPQLVQVIYGCMHAQVEIVFLNTRLSSAELAYQITDAEVDCVLVHADEAHKVTGKAVTFDALFMCEPKKMAFATQWAEEQTISIMYTSGTTGFPKGVRQTVQNHSSSAISSALHMGLTAQDSWLCTVPIFHISGFSILMRSLLYGMTVRLYEKFDPVSCALEMANGTVTKISLVAAMLEPILSYMEEQQLVAHPRFTTVLAGGGPVPIDYLKRAQRLQLHVAQTYGMTETSSQTATLSNEDAMRKIGSSGKPLFFNQIRIEGAQQPGDEGEICICGPHVTPGYIGRFKERIATEAGWLKTGDIGYLDEDGYLYVLDRRADLIISGGENIYPAEIENVLLAHPAVKEAGVCGVPHPKWGQVPAAYIVLKMQATIEELLHFCQSQLATYKQPSYIKIVNELPRNGANKLLRRKLHELDIK